MTIPVKGFFLPTSKSFPQDFTQLEPVLTKMYIDVANQVNNRINGSFDEFENITGEKWFNNIDPLNKRQSYRQVYEIPADQLPITPGSNATFPHEIDGLVAFTRMYGACNTNFFDSRPIPYASVLANSNIDLRVQGANIIVANGSSSPNILYGIIVLEYLLN